MTRTQAGNAGLPARPQSTWAERAIVLGGIALALLWTAAAPALGLDLETVAAAWLAALVWAAISSLTLALRRGFVHGDWSAFRRHTLSDGRDDRIDWSARTGRYAYLRIAEEHRRLMSGD